MFRAFHYTIYLLNLQKNNENLISLSIYILGVVMINYENFALRLSKLREEKDVSARDMSIKLGQNPAYINNIETNKALPSLSMLFMEFQNFDFSSIV